MYSYQYLILWGYEYLFCFVINHCILKIHKKYPLTHFQYVSYLKLCRHHQSPMSIKKFIIRLATSQLLQLPHFKSSVSIVIQWRVPKVLPDGCWLQATSTVKEYRAQQLQEMMKGKLTSHYSNRNQPEKDCELAPCRLLIRRQMVETGLGESFDTPANHQYFFRINSF